MDAAATPVEPDPDRAPPRATAFYRSGGRMRSRSVGAQVVCAELNLPAAPPWLVADWARDIAQHLALAVGDVEPLSLARVRRRWPDYRHCVAALRQWARARGLERLLVDNRLAIMACRGAPYHHDGAHYGGAAFCNLFLSEDQGLDLHFSLTGHRIALRRGTAVVFDTGQPHAVIARHREGFAAADFPPGHDCSQIFLSWELPIEAPALAQLLGITLDTAPALVAQISEAQVWHQGAAGDVCPQSGRWLATGVA